MRKRTKMIIDPKYVLIIVAVICVILMGVSFKFQDKMQPIRAVAGSIITPMQNGINKIGTKIYDKMEYVRTVKKVVNENKSLQEKINKLSAENRLLQQEKYELDNFRKLYSLDQQYAGLPKVAARVISSNPDNWYNTFIIDKGSKVNKKRVEYRLIFNFCAEIAQIMQHGVHLWAFAAIFNKYQLKTIK